MQTVETFLENYKTLIFFCALLVFGARRIYLIRREMSDVLRGSARALSAAVIFGGTRRFRAASEAARGIPFVEFMRENALTEYAGPLMAEPYASFIRVLTRRGADDEIISIELRAGLGLAPVEVYRSGALARVTAGLR
ncbi:MAG: hypothetical protein Q4D58_06490 [Synergistaceae bacterium]|nr:hypothetical protein [Synergistaceae bacterium]